LRVPHKYKNHQSFNNKHLSALFYQHGKEYQKGVNAAEFIAHLNLEKIYNNCTELQEGIKLLVAKCKLYPPPKKLKRPGIHRDLFCLK
jgi:hypothetical protein